MYLLQKKKIHYLIFTLCNSIPSSNSQLYSLFLKKNCKLFSVFNHYLLTPKALRIHTCNKKKYWQCICLLIHLNVINIFHEVLTSRKDLLMAQTSQGERITKRHQWLMYLSYYIVLPL